MLTSFKIILNLFTTILLLKGTYAQYYAYNEHKSEKLIWCTKSLEEQYKCTNFTKILEQDRALFDDAFMKLECYRAYSSEECINHIDNDRAYITTLDAGDVFLAGRYHSLVPIMQEKFEGGFKNYYSVAVIKANTLQDVYNLNGLRMKKACFPWVGSLAGWIVPIYTLQKEGGMEITDCNNQVKTAAKFFDNSCAVYSLIDKYNPIGDNSDRLCTLCTGKVPENRCTSFDPYYGYHGAFKCLQEKGDIAFLKHSTVFEIIESGLANTTIDQYQLLCKDGTRKPLTEYRQCNWGLIPSDAIVTSSAKKAEERKQYQRFLRKAVQLYSHKSRGNFTNTDRLNNPSNSNNDGNDYFNYNNPNRNMNDGQDNYEQRNRYDNRYDNQYENRFDNQYRNTDNNRFGRFENEFPTNTSEKPGIYDDYNSTYEKFELFESKKYGKLNLMFQDATRSLEAIPEDQHSFKVYLKDAYKYIHGIRECPIGRMTLCVTSDPEMEKCVKMRTALKAHLLKPELLCHKAHSQINCMQSIHSGIADIAVFDAGDIYTAGLRYNLIPFMSEIYNLGEPEYYVVAVAKESDPDTEITYLKGKNTCHSGINTAAGWIYPMAYLISNGWMRPYGCDSIRAAAEYFTKSCLPGAISSEYNIGVPYDNMCGLCHGTSFRYCRRDASEDYYGHTGAFRCLVEGGGHVAFVKHTTVNENVGGVRKEWWARDMLVDDFELLCADGTRSKLYNYEKCNLGKVKANAIVTRAEWDNNNTQINAYINLLAYAQQLYGRKDVDSFSFSMFSSAAPHYDLIFQDAARQLKIIPPEIRRYDLYLGGDFMRARRITDCYSNSNKLNGISYIFYVISIIISIQKFYNL